MPQSDFQEGSRLGYQGWDTERIVKSIWWISPWRFERAPAKKEDASDETQVKFHTEHETYEKYWKIKGIFSD